MRIVVLAGGLSPERDVSISSGSLIANALIENGHDVLLLDLLIGSDMPADGLEFRNRHSARSYEYAVPAREPDLEALKKRHPEEIGQNVISICKSVDCVFIALHGAMGENGKLQAIFDIHGIRYTGTGYIGCLLAMDKDISKKLAMHEGLLTAAWKLHDLDHESVKEIVDVAAFPCVIKPLSSGSSVGVSIVNTAEEMVGALDGAKKYENWVIIEDKIEGTEVSCAVLDGVALPVIEIRPGVGFYSYENKYQKGFSEEICPAGISQELTQEVQRVSVRIHAALRLGFYSRSDFIITDAGDVYYLESNTLPGMTPTSLLPQEAGVVGIGYNELCERIVTHCVG